MTAEQRERIEKIDEKIVGLILERKQAQRRGTWAQEQSIYAKIDELESQIKVIKVEP